MSARARPFAYRPRHRCWPTGSAVCTEGRSQSPRATLALSHLQLLHMRLGAYAMECKGWAMESPLCKECKG
eukprot:6185977-Pleurochrysis_carterae.AAC.2